jgi:hypothetical protein
MYSKLKKSKVIIETDYIEKDINKIFDEMLFPPAPKIKIVKSRYIWRHKINPL